jgi:thiol-disulfide isomerase/thioredoxin
MRFNLIVLSTAMLLGIAGYGYDLYVAQPARVSAPTVDTTIINASLAPDFTVVDVDGKSHHLADFRGQRVILHFWATWCTPCIAELPELITFAAQAPHTILLALSSDSSDIMVRNFLRRLSSPIRKAEKQKNIIVARDIDRMITARLYGTQVYPETILIDETGRMVRKLAGPQDWENTDPATLWRPPIEQK